ncbi:MAG: Nif11-like leader peptide family natural product precursor [Cyanobacteria bacterium]|nr:Nif11-like leader peptide family natural product precursor [Cyanobacteriota bacterium]
MTNAKDDKLPQDTYYGKAWTWDPNASEIQKNLEGFLNLLAKDLILQQRVASANSREEVVVIGKEYGFEFNAETLESRTKTLEVLTENDLNSYSWGRWGEAGAQRWALLNWKKL